MKDDAYASVVAFDKAPGFVDHGEFVGLIGKVNVADGHRCVASDKDSSVFNFALGPAFEGEAFIFWKGWVASHKIGKGACARQAKNLGFFSEGRFE